MGFPPKTIPFSTRKKNQNPHFINLFKIKRRAIPILFFHQVKQTYLLLEVLPDREPALEAI